MDMKLRSKRVKKADAVIFPHDITLKQCLLCGSMLHNDCYMKWLHDRNKQIENYKSPFTSDDRSVICPRCELLPLLKENIFEENIDIHVN